MTAAGAGAIVSVVSFMDTMKNKFDILEFLKTRSLSWSALSSFEYDPEQWYDRYILAKEEPPSEEMLFGKLVGERLASDPTFMPHIPRLGTYEYELRCTLGKIPLIGFMDDYKPTTDMAEFKTGVKPWDQSRADSHGQIDMYLLQHYLINKVKPEDMTVNIYWMPTKKNGDFTVSFVDEKDVKVFPTRRTMRQVLEFGVRINATVQAMQLYVNSRM